MASVTPVPRRRHVPVPVRVLAVLALLYLFLVAVQMLGGTFKELGAESARNLIRQVSNPFAALAVGTLATVLVQSSSVTTSTIVSIAGGLLVSRHAGTVEVVDLEASIAPFVPMIMGANIGTTITNTLVSMGHVTRSREFERAFAGATMHDFFNLLTVAILLPVELATGFLTRASVALVEVFHLEVGHEFESPVKTTVKEGYKLIKAAVSAILGGDHGSALYLFLMVVAAVSLIFVCLVFITKNMKSVVAGRLERAINRALERSGLLGIVIGILATVAVQSSSITTSILVPMFGAGLLSLQNGFPIMLGANVGTTVTALLAAVASGPAGLAIAIVHLLFNVTGILLFYPVPFMRRLPIGLAAALARRTASAKWWILLYVGGVFVVLPLLGMLFFG